MNARSLTCGVVLIGAMVLLTISPRIVRGQQVPSVYVHGPRAEALVNSCAAVDKTDLQAKSGLSYCFGYISGVVDMHNALNAVLPSPKDNTYCVPDDATTTQLAKVVVKYGNDHPEELNEAALVMVSNSFVRAFPCQ